MDKVNQSLLIAGGVLIFFIIIILGSKGGTTGDVPKEPNNKSIPLEELEIPESQDTFLVTRVIDGDTIELISGKKVRLICIDTPESGEEGYSEAKDFLENLILNKLVRLEKDVSEVDKYDRLLRYIYLDEVFVNELIVKQGYAETYIYNPDTKLCPEIQEAEDYAKRYELGMWEKEKIEEKIIEEEPEPEPISEPEPEPKSEIVCDSNYYNCGDFSTCLEVMEVFDSCGGNSNDIHRLDGDNDGTPCETLCGN